MINFLIASVVPSNVDTLILLPELPKDLMTTLDLVKDSTGYKRQQTRVDVETMSVEILPDNYLEHVGQYVLHVIDRVSSTTVQLYKIEKNNFISVRKFIVNKGSNNVKRA